MTTDIDKHLTFIPFKMSNYDNSIDIQFINKNILKMEKPKDSAGADKKEDIKRFTIKNATDLQRIRLEKLMKNPVSAEI